MSNFDPDSDQTPPQHYHHWLPCYCIEEISYEGINEVIETAKGFNVDMTEWTLL